MRVLMLFLTLTALWKPATANAIRVATDEELLQAILKAAPDADYSH